MKYLFTILLLSSIVVKGQAKMPCISEATGLPCDVIKMPEGITSVGTLTTSGTLGSVAISGSYLDIPRYVSDSLSAMRPIFNNNADEFEVTFIPYDTLTVKRKKQRKYSHYYSLDTSVLQPICGYHSKLHRCLNCGKSEWMTEEKAFKINFKDLE